MPAPSTGISMQHVLIEQVSGGSGVSGNIVVEFLLHAEGVTLRGMGCACMCSQLATATWARGRATALAQCQVGPSYRPPSKPQHFRQVTSCSFGSHTMDEVCRPRVIAFLQRI